MSPSKWLSLAVCLAACSSAPPSNSVKKRGPGCPRFLVETIPLERVAQVIRMKRPGRHLAGRHVGQKTLKALAKNYNKQMPIMLDKDTRLDGVSPRPAGHLNYSVTFVGCQAKEIASANFDKLVALYARLLCSKKESRYALSRTAGFVYTFKGKEGRRVGSIKVTKRDCR